MIGLEGKQLHSAHLTLRLAEEKDKPALQEIMQNEKVTKPAGTFPITTAEEFSRFYEHITENHAGLVILADSDVIGFIRINKQSLKQSEYSDKSGVYLGFIIGEPYQNKGYGSEMLQTITEYLLEHFDYCTTDCFTENLASRRIIEKCGYHFLEDFKQVFDALNSEEKHLRRYIVSH